MRLLHTGTLQPHLFYDPATRPQYAVLSYTWSPDFPAYSDFAVSPTKPQFPLIAAACSAARDLGYDWIWIHSICVDHASTAEVSEAVNSAFAWFRDAAACLAYISDLPPADSEGAPDNDAVHGDANELLASSKWFSRAWTLPELLAPPNVRFYDRDWNFRGSKADLSGIISRTTNISEDILLDSSLIPDVALAKRMSWAAARSTARVEDVAYSLLGIFGVNMSVIYGEGAKAFARLLVEILKESQDTSLLIWDPTPSDQRPLTGLLASSPAEFSRFASCPARWCKPLRFDGEMQITSRGLSIKGNFIPVPRCRNRILLDLGHHDGTPGKRAALVLVRVQDAFVRPAANAVVAISGQIASNAAPETITAKRDIDRKTAFALSTTLQSAPPANPGIAPGTGLPFRPMAYPTSPPSKRKSAAPHSPTISSTSPPAPSEFFILSQGSTLASLRTPKRGLSQCVPPAGDDKRQRRTIHTFAQKLSTMARASSETADGMVNDGEEEENDRESTTSEENTSVFEPAMREPPPTLEEGHPYLAVLDELCEEAHAALPTWKNDTTMSVCSDANIKPAPREPTMFLACPFQKRDPLRHYACLTREQLATAAEVKAHACRVHRLPSYCPVCYELFPATSARDEHIVRRSCNLRPRPVMDGVSEDQRQRLRKKSPGSREDRWFAIWDILFASPRPASPYLDDSAEAKRVGLAREFWAERGQLIVSAFLEKRGLLDWKMKDEERSLSALHALVLERLVDAEAKAGEEEEEEGWVMVTAGAAPPVQTMDLVNMGARLDHAPDAAAPRVAANVLAPCRHGTVQGSCARQVPL